eukprot:3858901-Amphidinium_carterae.2
MPDAVEAALADTETTYDSTTKCESPLILALEWSEKACKASQLPFSIGWWSPPRRSVGQPPSELNTCYTSLD